MDYELLKKRREKYLKLQKELGESLRVAFFMKPATRFCLQN